MSNVRFLSTMKFDTATITASSAASGLPAANAVDTFVAKVWRTTGKTSEWIKFDLGSAKKNTMIAIFGHNLTSGATVTVQANSTDAWIPPSYSHAVTWNAQAMVLFLDQTYRWWRIAIADTGNPDGYIEIGRICAGEYYEPAVNVTDGIQRKVMDPSTIEESEGRQGYAVEKETYRTYEVQFTGIALAQQQELETIFRAVKTIRPLVFALDPDNAPETDTIYCRITTGLGTSLQGLGEGEVTLAFQELVT
jgi:hypothetical protein